MEQFNKILGVIDDAVWGVPLIVLILAVGILLTIRTRLVQIHHLPKALKYMFKDEEDGEGEVSSFGALCTALSATIGTGNIVGVATAIAAGGPGALFWMEVAAFFGMATKYAEGLLAVKYREIDENGKALGGPFYYIEKGLHCKWLARLFSVLLILALGFTGNMVQSNSICAAFETSFGLPSFVGGLVVAALAAVILLGGIRRIASFTEKVVPVMACLYLVGSIVVLVFNASRILPAFGLIFEAAFHPSAAFGGVAGYTVLRSMKYGVARGLFSNEAGMGSTPHAHAAAKVDRPEKQGHVAIVSVFFDTFVVLTITALVILTSGVLPGMIREDAGINVTQAAFSQVMGGFGAPFIAVCLLFFAFSTIISWYYYGETNVRYLFRSKKAVPVYKALVVVFVFAGSLFQSGAVWALSDVCNGLMVLPNLAALVLLFPTVLAMSREDRSHPLRGYAQRAEKAEKRNAAK